MRFFEKLSLAWRALLTAALCLGLSACGLDDFEEEIVETVTIPATTMQIGNPFTAEASAGLNSLMLSQARNFQNQGVTPGDVDAIFVKSLRLEVVLPPGAPAVIGEMDNYLTKVEFFVQSPDIEKKTIATLDMVPAQSSADLTVDSMLNLKPYAVAPSMQIGAEITLKQAPAINVELRTILTLLIDINLLGI